MAHPFSRDVDIAAHPGDPGDGLILALVRPLDGDACVLGRAHNFLAARAYASQLWGGGSPLVPWTGLRWALVTAQ